MERSKIIEEREKPDGMSAEDELAWALSRVLRWPNPAGTVADAYIPGWLRARAVEALTRYVGEPSGAQPTGESE